MSGHRLRWAVTGGIGSGKSTVARLLAAHGVRVIDADRIAHEALEPGGSAFSEVAHRWPEALRDGRVDRRTLGARVFGQPDELSLLESLVHPWVRKRIATIIEDSAELDLAIEISVLDDLVPDGFDVVVVDAPDEIRIARLRGRGMSDDEIDQRLSAQPSREEWLSNADVVISNRGDLQELETRVDDALRRFRPPARDR